MEMNCEEVKSRISQSLTSLPIKETLEVLAELRMRGLVPDPVGTITVTYIMDPPPADWKPDAGVEYLSESHRVISRAIFNWSPSNNDIFETIRLCISNINLGLKPGMLVYFASLISAIFTQSVGASRIRVIQVDKLYEAIGCTHNPGTDPLTIEYTPLPKVELSGIKRKRESEKAGKP